MIERAGFFHSVEFARARRQLIALADGVVLDSLW
jgi:hypothetical protein